MKNRHIVKYRLDWICKTWTGFVKDGLVKYGFVKGVFVKHGFIKHGFVKHGFVKGGFVTNSYTENYSCLFSVFLDVLYAFSRVHCFTYYLELPVEIAI